MPFPAIQGPEGSEDYSWTVQLFEDQELVQIDDRHAEVRYDDVHVAVRIEARAAHDAEGATVPTTLAVSDTLDQPVRTRVDLGCSRDCLYLVTLVRADGTPVVATRGALRGGAPAVPIILAPKNLGTAAYVVDVRLVAQVNPGEVMKLIRPSP
jgi:hypothetical protein